VNLQEFRPVKNYEGRYLVSPCGTIYSIRARRLLTPRLNEKGYLTVELWENYKRKVSRVHRIVAETFIENPFNLKEINHKDGDKQNNHIANLEWCTRSENIKHAYKTGLRMSRKGVKLGKRDKTKGECYGKAEWKLPLGASH
jgi:hypothetical protein